MHLPKMFRYVQSRMQYPIVKWYCFTKGSRVHDVQWRLRPNFINITYTSYCKNLVQVEAICNTLTQWDALKFWTSVSIKFKANYWENISFFRKISHFWTLVWPCCELLDFLIIIIYFIYEKNYRSNRAWRNVQCSKMYILWQSRGYLRGSSDWSDTTWEN